MKERQRMGERWTGPLHRLDLPFRVIWGKRDPIAVYAIAEKLCDINKAAKLYTLDDVAHYPQLEAPGLVAECLQDAEAFAPAPD
jgi:pimeloyl-ACP methyl ester carboxylesterase